MYILINTDTHQVEAKHPNFAALSELGILLCSESQHVMPMTIGAFMEMGDVEFQMVYINLTDNKAGAVYAREDAAKVLLDYLNECPETKLATFDLGKQCDYALEHDLQGRCVYVPGTFVPCTDGSLPWEPLRRVADKAREQALVDNVATVELKEPQQPAFEVKQEKEVTTASGAIVSAPRDGSVRDVIWKKADELWEAAGKPTDKPLVLKLRRDIMAALEIDGIKKTSSSTELGKWHLDRAPF